MKVLSATVYVCGNKNCIAYGDDVPTPDGRKCCFCNRALLPWDQVPYEHLHNVIKQQLILNRD